MPLRRFVIQPFGHSTSLCTRLRIRRSCTCRCTISVRSPRAGGTSQPTGSRRDETRRWRPSSSMPLRRFIIQPFGHSASLCTRLRIRRSCTCRCSASVRPPRASGTSQPTGSRRDETRRWRPLQQHAVAAVCYPTVRAFDLSPHASPGSGEARLQMLSFRSASAHKRDKPTNRIPTN